MNLQLILSTIFILNVNKAICERNPELVITERGVESVTPCGIGLKFFIELNNTSYDRDYEVQVTADQCCLEADGSLDCDVLEMIGDCVGFIPRGAIKTVRMVAPILDPYERRGYCIVYLDSKCNYNGKNMRDTVKINFDTKIGKVNKILQANVKPCRNVDEDPLNDCKPVDCDSYYNTHKPHYSKKLKRCVNAPPCIADMLSELPNAVYDPITNRCIEGNSINKRDIDYIKTLTPKERHAKDVLIVNNFDDQLNNNITDPVRDAMDKVPMCKKCKKIHILNPILSECATNRLKEYVVSNKYTLLIFGGVITVQCCFIAVLVYFFTKSCACKEKKVIRKFFNYRQDASVTTPLIGTSNIYTETDYNYESDSSNVDKKLKCYKSCDKEKSNVKKSMSDDVLSKCLNRRNWSRQQYTDAIPEVNNETQVDIGDSNENRIQLPEAKKQSETKVAFEDEKPKSSRIKNMEIPKCLNKEIIAREKEEIEEYNSSEREIQCHSYDVQSTVTGFNPSTATNLGYIITENGRSVATEKAAQAYFSNDSIDDLLSEKGIYLTENISKFALSTDSNAIKSSTPTTVTSKTSKNVVKNLMALLHKKSRTNTSDPGKRDLDVKLIHMSQATICSSNDSGCKFAKKDSRSSM